MNEIRTLGEAMERQLLVKWKDNLLHQENFFNSGKIALLCQYLAIIGNVCTKDYLGIF